MIYLWTKTFHLLFVMGFMACVFYLPRILVNIAETRGDAAVQARLHLMGMRLYRFGHVMFAVTALLGLPLWLGFRIDPALFPPVAMVGAWMHAKLLLVALMFGFYIATGRLLKRSAAGGALPSGKALRWYNEIPLLLLVPIIYLVLAKPF
jgi:putative membrane protein